MNVPVHNVNDFVVPSFVSVPVVHLAIVVELKAQPSGR